MSGKHVYHFFEGNAEMKRLLGGKGANLGEMTSLGLPIPPGFTITTEACQAYYKEQMLTPQLKEQIHAALRIVEEAKGQRFGDRERPLLVSVRSGAVVSMPGMMDTVLNLGLNDDTVQGLAHMSGDKRFAYDCYRRFIQMFGDVVLGVNAAYFERALEEMKRQHDAIEDREVPADGWMSLTERFKLIVQEHTRKPFPQDVREQLERAVEAVFRSWNNQRAQVYRRTYGIPGDQGTAVTVQAMVFGNLGDASGTGVMFTRDPSTGQNEIYGEYLMNAQGEDVVAGVRTPKPIRGLEQAMPDVYAALLAAAERLEQHYKDMQDIEFTVENHTLYLLQTRSGKRTAQAALKIAVDLTEAGVISAEEAVNRIEPAHLDQLLHRSIDDEEASHRVVARGLPASPGASSGLLVLDADLAEQWAREGRKVILVTTETTPEDIHGVIAAEGVLTARGGMTSHAAVVARGMGKPCVCGCEALRIDEQRREVSCGDTVIREGECVSIDGTTGRVIAGEVRLKDPVITPELSRLLEMADHIRTLKVYANADTPGDAARARQFGAEGVGLCRTEHMFMSPVRLPVVQSMILANTDEERKRALARILPMQQADFAGIFAAMDGLPVTVRLLDPPLHEFLPKLEQLREQQLAQRMDADAAPDRKLEELIAKVRGMQETNPMLGLRGCRLGLLFPEIYDMQLEALFKAAQRCLREGVQVRPDIMIPLVGHPNELKFMRTLVDQTAEQVLGEDLKHCPYSVGTMIEVPRAALTADQIARHADFFSFGTNDLTQMTFGFSRDDAEGKFLNEYLERGILPDNPFQVLDEDGVGVLIEWATAKGRAVRPALKTGICGEHGGDRASIFFCHRQQLDYISCSPFRVPYARIAAAQAALQGGYSTRRDVSSNLQQGNLKSSG